MNRTLSRTCDAKIYDIDRRGCCHRLTKVRFEHKLTTRDQAKNVAHLTLFQSAKMMYSSTAVFLPRQQLNCIEKPRGSETTIYIQSPEAKAIVRDMSKSHVSRAVIGRRLSRGTLLAFVCIMAY